MTQPYYYQGGCDGRREGWRKLLLRWDDQYSWDGWNGGKGGMGELITSSSYLAVCLRKSVVIFCQVKYHHCHSQYITKHLEKCFSRNAISQTTDWFGCALILSLPMHLFGFSILAKSVSQSRSLTRWPGSLGGTVASLTPLRRPKSQATWLALTFTQVGIILSLKIDSESWNNGPWWDWVDNGLWWTKLGHLSDFLDAICLWPWNECHLLTSLNG